MRSGLIVILAFFGLCVRLFAAQIQPSFDCKNAQSVVENLICADSELASLEFKMARLYNDKRAIFRGEDRQNLLNSQRQWLKKFQNCKTKSCLVEALESRIYELQNLRQSINYDDYAQYRGQINPSFDCTKAKSVVENLICADSELAYLDSKMAQIYYEKRKNLNGEERKNLIQSQREWVKKYENCVTKICLIDTLESRISYLQKVQIDSIESTPDREYRQDFKKDSTKSKSIESKDIKTKELPKSSENSVDNARSLSQKGSFKSTNRSEKIDLEGYYMLRHDNPNKYKGEITITNCDDSTCDVSYKGIGSENTCSLSNKDLKLVRERNEAFIKSKNANFKDCEIRILPSDLGIYFTKKSWWINCNKMCEGDALIKWEEEYVKKEVR